MSSKILELYEIIINKFSESKPILDFCNEAFGKPHTIYLGYKDEENPPIEDYPCIIITALDRFAKGDSTGDVPIVGIIDIFIQNDAEPEETEIPLSGIKIKVFNGVKQIEKLRNLVEKELLNIKAIGCKIDIDGETDLENLHPFFKAITTVTFFQKKCPRNRRI